FGIFFIFILVASKVAQLYFGNSGAYLTSLISGLADVDAITISMSKLAMEGTMSSLTATRAITLAVLTNTAIKIFYVYMFGSRRFANRIAISLGIVLTLGLAAITVM
ncbi:MAG TPA: DUF4010 domain-containing protein, partial [Candidatus Peregrinibacteria bacterium]|nr:DUF4010 domain-containing protein [Candidatus Peregrinibacteria bacterium]